MDTIERSENLPALADNPLVPVRGMSPALQIMLDDKLFDRVRVMAGYLARAEGFVPKHLAGKGEACFAVMCRAIAWKLDPFAVAMATYQTPSGAVGFEGKLCQAILENSGQLVGGVKFDHYCNVTLRLKGGIEKVFRSNDPAVARLMEEGAVEIARSDWSKIQGKFEIKTSPKGGKYPSPAWDTKDEAGLGVLVSAQIRGEVEPRTFSFDLVQAFPRNSTLWATDPKTQLQYLAVRRFANSAAPGIFMGTPFDREDLPIGPEPVDVNPRPKREDFDAGAKPSTTDVDTESSDTEKATTFEAVAADGEVRTFDRAIDAAGFLLQQMQDAAKARGANGAEGVWESNGLLVTQLREDGKDKLADDLKAELEKLIAPPKPAQAKASAKESPAPSGNSAGAPTVAEGAPGRETPSNDGEKINKPARDEAFFARKSYAITMPKKGGSWPAWDAEVRAADRDTRTPAEHAKIIEDNAVIFDAYERANPKAMKDLYEFFKATAVRLSAGEARQHEDHGDPVGDTWDE